MGRLRLGGTGRACAHNTAAPEKTRVCGRTGAAGRARSGAAATWPLMQKCAASFAQNVVTGPGKLAITPALSVIDHRYRWRRSEFREETRPQASRRRRPEKPKVHNRRRAFRARREPCFFFFGGRTNPPASLILKEDRTTRSDPSRRRRQEARKRLRATRCVGRFDRPLEPPSRPPLRGLLRMRVADRKD